MARKLSVSVHIMIVSLIIAGCDILQPGGVFEIPFDGDFETFFKLEGGLPAEFALEF